MEKRNLKSVDEALNILPGVFNPRLIPGGMLDSLANGGVTLRGIPRANKTLVLIDGITINDSYSGSQRSMLSIAPEDVERIEVVRGPFSALYGGYAMGGVVNIITRMPEKREATLKTGYGSAWDRGEAPADVYRVYASYGDNLWDKLSFLVSYGRQGTNGYAMDEAFTTTTPPSNITGWSLTTDVQGKNRYLIGDTGDEQWWDDRVGVKLSYKLSDTSSISFFYNRFRYLYEFDSPHTYLHDITSGNPVIWPNESSYLALARGPSYNEDNIYSLSYEAKIGSLASKLVLGFHDGDYWYTAPSPGYATFAGGSSNPSQPAGRVTETPKKRYNADLQFSLPIGERQIFTFGGSYLGGSVETSRHSLTNWKDDDSQKALEFKSEGKERTFSLYAQDEVLLFTNLTVFPALRLDWWEAYDGSVNVVGAAGYPKDYDSTDKVTMSPKFAVVYRPYEKTVLRASVGTAFRPPTVYELYSAAITSESVIEGNPSLKPEKTFSWDVGIRQEVWKGGSVELSYFENYLSDLLYSVTIGKAPPPYENRKYKRQENVGDAESKGIELGVNQKLGEHVKVFANYTYTHATITKASKYQELEGKNLVQTPKHLFNLGSELSFGPFSAFLTGRYVSKRYSSDLNTDKEEGVWGAYDPYFLVDLKLSYAVTKFCTISFSINNLFDEDYYAYYKAPGRSWYTEVSLKF